jgi:hypothetical protein
LGNSVYFWSDEMGTLLELAQPPPKWVKLPL